ncbi:haloacid dehalogenase-like hydrolase [Motilimonas cestriensis]|uniref:Haloacid dehalogenase-like hydrolase n=1 Tax=Motilimonas cestriensis TaxID=2742685 RepID=A0ABS8WGF0_9GAMM|nr:haloacid dehalogenase-like hydrolase [Motilimonas cestriensis]MCE2596793.1 haloacid dehalogenase-like hydrolase [Motilimonas cestriensis]
MHKRLLDCSASELNALDKNELLYAIKASEGRVLVSENIVITSPLLTQVTNAELAASQGADLLLLNMFDAENPVINGMPENIAPTDLITELKRLTGRVIGVNLEAVDPEFAQQHDEIWQMSSGRVANAENAQKLYDMGVRFIVITGNPNNGVSNRAISHALQQIHSVVGDKLVIITGKMHGAGVVSESGAKIITGEDVSRFAKNGADIILVPAPGTVPGMSQDYVSELINVAHQHKVMAMTAIGTSQEGADVSTIRQIALMSKMAGADLHHIGDTGYMGMALPENIQAYSVVIRGIRHTYTRIARSINR